MKNILETIRQIPETISAKDNSAAVNRQIDENINYYKVSSRSEINQRLEELDKEWDLERTVELNTSALVLTGVILSATAGKKWLFIPAIAAGFLATFALGKRTAFFNNLRTRGQVARERFGLEQVLRDGVNNME